MMCKLDFAWFLRVSIVNNSLEKNYTLSCMIGSKDDQQLHHKCQLMKLGVQVCLLYILAWVCSIVLWDGCLCYTMVFKLTKVYTNDILPLVCFKLSFFCIPKCKQMTLAISTLKISPPCILKRKTSHPKYLHVLW